MPDDKSVSFKIFDSDVGGMADLIGEYVLDFRCLESGKPYLRREVLGDGITTRTHPNGVGIVYGLGES